MRVSQPIGQKRHTNIAIVSVRKKVEGRDYKFEIACYPNKVVNQREGLEDDLSQVLQTETIFTNVSRGDIATNEDLITVFGTTNHLKICKQIIQEGNLQVSNKEREYISESLQRDVINLLTQMTMDAQTGYPLTATQLQAAMDDIHFRITSKGSLRGSRSSKQKEEEDEVKLIARDCVKRLELGLPNRIARVNMLIKISLKDDEKIPDEEIMQLAEQRCIIERENAQTVLVTCHPSLMKVIKDTFGDKIQTFSVVDSFVHKVLPNQKLVKEVIAPTVLVAEPPKVEITPTPEHTCKTCGNISFETAAFFRAHCKSEWHSFNKKREVKKLEPVDHLEFEMIADDTKNAFNAVDP
jgi:ribosome maturation protein SDO1